MKIFVASWFFPPNTSSEGIVTYKLLRNSAFIYDVVNVTSHRWGYKNDFPIDSTNIRVITVDTDSVDEWKREVMRLFSENHRKEPYCAFMTRCMPREALEIGWLLKQEYPDVPWICSLADPVGNDPYVRLEIMQSDDLSSREKNSVLSELMLPAEKWTRNWEQHASDNVADQFKYKRLQDIAFRNADLLIAPCYEQADYMMQGVTQARPVHIFPHTFDTSLYSQTIFEHFFAPYMINFSFFGYSYARRSVRPFLEALYWIQQRYPELFKKMQVHIFGNCEEELHKTAVQKNLTDAVCFHGNIDYLQSLALMKQSDCLLHVDTFFPEFKETGGSIFLAGKLADYVGAGRPILGITGYGSPAWNVISLVGGKTFVSNDICGIAHAMMNITTRTVVFEQNNFFKELYNAKKVSAEFDALIMQRNSQNWAPEQTVSATPESPEIRAPSGAVGRLIHKLATSRLVTNDLTMRILRRQKENNGLFYRIYKKSRS